MTFGLRNACGVQVTPFVCKINFNNQSFFMILMKCSLISDWPPTIPEFVTEGLTSPTTSIALIAVTTLVTAMNVEIGHLRRLYGQSMSIAIKKDPEALERGSVNAAVPNHLPWQLKFAHGAGIFGVGMMSVASCFAPSVS